MQWRANGAVISAHMVSYALELSSLHMGYMTIPVRIWKKTLKYDRQLDGRADPPHVATPCPRGHGVAKFGLLGGRAVRLNCDTFSMANRVGHRSHGSVDYVFFSDL